MKTSQKILITVAGVAIALLVGSLMVLRSDVQSVILKAEAQSRYQEMTVDDFTSVDFSANWEVRIRQGREYKVEVATEVDGQGLPRVETVDGVLYFKTDTVGGQPPKMLAKVTVPTLETIRAVRGTKIHMEKFQTDTLKVVLEDGVAFTGKDNQFVHVSFETSGDNWLEFSDDPNN